MKRKDTFRFHFTLIIMAGVLPLLPACPPPCTDVVTFHDADLEEEIRIAVNKPTGDILCSDMLTITALSHCGCDNVDCDTEICGQDPTDPDYNAIWNVLGLEYATNLARLELPYNEISVVGSLAGLTKLVHLELDFNDILDLTPLAGLTKLEVLEINDNNFVNISPLAGLTSLRVLKLDSNLITDVSALSGLVNISQLDLSDNQISDIAPLVANAGLGFPDTLDLEGNPLNATSCDVYVPELEARGVTINVIGSCP